MNEFPTSEQRHHRRHFLGASALTFAAVQFGSLRAMAVQSSETKITGAMPQPPAKIIADAPLAEPLTRGTAFIEYRTENLRIMPVFGPKAAELSPRIGHLHVTVDDTPWHWADTSGNPIIVAPLSAGPHKVEIVLVNANHQPLDRAFVEFVVPVRFGTSPHATHQ